MTEAASRKPLLAGHIAFTVGLLGADLALVALGVAGVGGAAPETIYPATGIVVRYLAAPLALLSLVSGVLLGVLTPWGLLKHGWVITKLVVTSVLTLVLLTVLLPAIALAAERAIASPELITDAQRLRLAIAPAIAATLLLLNVVLATYKPRLRSRSRSRAGEVDATRRRGMARAVGSLPALLAALLATIASPGAAGAQDEGGAALPSEVHVVATLYQRHAEVPAYGHDTLRAIIERVDPDVVVLDVSPGELRRQSVHPSKAEYPEVIFPLVQERGYRAYAGEPDEPLFSEVVSRLTASLAAFRTRTPSRAQADRAHADATFAVLKELWQTPAAVNGPVTDQVLAARRALQDALAGPDVAEAWSQWNDHLVGVMRRAARENPGRRILVLVGVENAALVRPALRALPEVRLVDTFAAPAHTPQPQPH